MSLKLTWTFVLGAGFSAGGDILMTDSLLKEAFSLRPAVMTKIKL